MAATSGARRQNHMYAGQGFFFGMGTLGVNDDEEAGLVEKSNREARKAMGLQSIITLYVYI